MKGLGDESHSFPEDHFSCSILGAFAHLQQKKLKKN